MAKYITTHNGSAVSREHNLRNEKVTAKQKHIDTSLSVNNEILIDENPRTAYDRLFGNALSEYNAKQSRPER